MFKTENGGDLNLENFDRQPARNYMRHWDCTIFRL